MTGDTGASERLDGSAMTCRVYREHGALTADLRGLQCRGLVQLVHFPYDPNSRSGSIAPAAASSAVQWRDLNLSWQELKDRGDTWNDFEGSRHLPEILSILGASNRRDALHVDSAFKDGCRAFITRDTDILAHRARLEALPGLRFFNPDSEAAALRAVIEKGCRAV
jgi:hypothetical protein